MNAPRIIALSQIDNPDALVVHAGDEGQAPPTDDILIDKHSTAIAAAGLLFSCDGTPGEPLGAMLKMLFPLDAVPNLYVRLSPLALRQLGTQMIDIAASIEAFAAHEANAAIDRAKGGAA